MGCDGGNCGGTPSGPRRRSGTTGLDTRPSDVSDFEDEADDLGCHERLVVGCLSSGLEPSSPGKDEARRRFVIVAVLGNLDDFLMYFSIVVSLHFCWWASVSKSTSVSGATPRHRAEVDAANAP